MQKPKGTKDIYGEEIKRYQNIFGAFCHIAKKYDFVEIITPIFEHAELFQKTVGKESDIVGKELYTFKDKSGREISLRPEGTAPVGRVISENKLDIKKEFNKLFYIGKMFRYEKPQKGRLREFYQIGLEYFLKDKFAFSETIVIALEFLKKLNIKDFVLKINNISSTLTRKKYEQELSKYFTKNSAKLSLPQLKKIDTNPLRIMDDKEFDIKNFSDIPKLEDFYNDDEKKELSLLKKILKNLNIKFEVDPFLVRGLDYYSDFVFEIVSTSEKLGAKTTIIGGGQYSNLLDNNKIQASGFAIGVERILELINSKELEDDSKTNDLFIIFDDEEEIIENQKNIYKLINQGIRLNYNKEISNFNKHFKKALKTKPNFVYFKEKGDWYIKDKSNKTKASFDEIPKIIKGEK